MLRRAFGDAGRRASPRRRAMDPTPQRPASARWLSQADQPKASSAAGRTKEKNTELPANRTASGAPMPTPEPCVETARHHGNLHTRRCGDPAPAEARARRFRDGPRLFLVLPSRKPVPEHAEKAERPGGVSAC
jgi:hypothetical protein